MPENEFTERPMGDYDESGKSLSNLTNIAVADDGRFAVLDSVYSRIFVYSSDGNLMYEFGGSGNAEGKLNSPVGICFMDEKVLVYADPDLIHQVAYNLLDNAIKFTPAGGTIRFGVERLGPEVEVSIWNSGQGISPEALPYVFQRFYKEDQSRGLHARGAGLGLNICKVLVNLSGGQIRVESKQGEWCRFVFTLPVQPPNPGGMKRLPDESGRPGAVEDPASMKPVD